MAINDVWKATAVFSNADTGEELSTGLHFTESSIGPPTITEVGAAFKDWWNVAAVDGDAQKVFHESAIKLERVELRKVSPLSPTISQYTTGLPIAGTALEANTSPNDAVLVSLRTDNIGRSYRGRAFLPPPSVAKLSGPGALTSADATFIADQYFELVRSLNAKLTILDVIVWSPTVPAKTPITAVKVDRRLRSQRRREPEAALYVSGD